MKQYFWNILVSIDQFCNVLLGGDPDETISSRCGKWARDGKNNKGLRKHFWITANFVCEKFEKDHFAKSIEEDEGKNSTIE